MHRTNPENARLSASQSSDGHKIERERHSRVARWFEELCRLEGAERMARIEEMRREDRVGVRLLMELVHLDEAGSSPLDEPHTERASERPDRIGDYRILDELGRGGMAVVWLAEQDIPKRRVALKVLRYAPWSAASLARFEREASALGRLNHPGIAQVFDAGTQRHGADSFAYLAMEWVEGDRLAAWASQASLDECLSVLARVSDALHYAHTQGVIHRDVKPSNVLVTREGDPKVLDFGVARLRTSEEQPGDPMTRLGEVVGTLQYMAPEQVRADGGDVDERTDVYALGMIAYELLGGRLPYEVDGLPVHRAAERIETVEPVRLGRIDSKLAGDVETIVSRALEKDPERRTATAREFGDDLRRHLSGLPILARRASAAYRVRKFVSRNRTVVALTMLTILTLAFAAAGMSWKARQAEGYARTSEQRLERALEVTRVLSELFDTINPEVEGPGARVVDLIARSDEVLDDTERSPLVNAALHHSLGRAWNSIGDDDKAHFHLKTSVELYEANGGEDWELAQSLSSLGSMYLNRGGAEPDEIRTYLERALDAAERAHGADSPICASIRGTQCTFEWRFGDRTGVLEEMRRVVRDLEARVSPTDSMLGLARRGLLTSLIDSGEFAEAEEIRNEAFEVIQSIYGEDHPRTAMQRTFNAELLREMGHYEEAVAESLAALEILENAKILDRGRITATVTQVGGAYLSLGRADEARVHLERAMELTGRPAENPGTNSISIGMLLAHSYLQLADVERAGALLEELEEVATPVNGGTVEVRANVLEAIGMLASWRGDLETAYAYQRESNDMRRSEPGTTRLDLAGALYNEATLLRRLGRAEESIPPMQEALAIECEVRGPEHPYALQAAYELGVARVNLDRHREAVDTFLAIVPGFAAAYGDESQELATVLMMAGISEVIIGEHESAYARLLARAELPADPDTAARLSSWLAEAELGLGRPEAAWARVRASIDRLCEAGGFRSGHDPAKNLAVTGAKVLVALDRTDEALELTESIGVDPPPDAL